MDQPRKRSGTSTNPGGDCLGVEKVFNDAVHGAISLPSLCVKVVDTPQFQRLRFLKQLGCCYFVYPSAAHNRFEHCLGVCHLAGQLVRAIQSCQPELGINNADVLCVQIAGLCHDLGHGPFSHLWESFLHQAHPEKEWKHEKASLKMFDHMLKVNDLNEEFKKYKLFEKDIQFIKELIDGPKNLEEGKWPYEGRPKEKAFLYEVVANKRTGIDVDKWDYFMRDGHSLGIKVRTCLASAPQPNQVQLVKKMAPAPRFSCNTCSKEFTRDLFLKEEDKVTFDHQRLIKFCRVVDVEGEGPRICVRDKECDNLYDMFYARCLLHRTAYQHRVTKTIELMLIDAFLYADKHIKYHGEDGTEYALGDVCDDMSAYTTLTDEVFHRILLAEEKNPDLLRAKEILKNILTRQLYLYVGHTQPITDDINQDSLLMALSRNIPAGSSLSKDKLGIQEVRFNYGMKMKNPIEFVRFYSKALPDVAKAIRKEDISTMLPHNFQEVIFRLVCKSYDDEDFNDAKTAFRAACKELRLKEPSVDSWPSPLTAVV